MSDASDLPKPKWKPRHMQRAGLPFFILGGILLGIATVQAFWPHVEERCGAVLTPASPYLLTIVFATVGFSLVVAGVFVNALKKRLP
jgi:hypothetical protein